MQALLDAVNRLLSNLRGGGFGSQRLVNQLFGVHFLAYSLDRKCG